MRMPFSDKPKLPKIKKPKSYQLIDNCISCGANEYIDAKCCYCGRPSKESDVYKNLIQQDIYSVGSAPIGRGYGKPKDDCYHGEINYFLL